MENDLEIIRTASTKFMALMKEHFDITLAYNKESLIWVDKYIKALANSDVDPKSRAESLWIIGAWFGELLVHSFKGRWIFDEQWEQWTVKMEAEEPFTAYPFSKVLNQVKKGQEESISVLYNNLLLKGF
ncbi:MAG: hypothetical protein ACE5FT_00880 [Candidatus Nanoarchaeia archaeon]